MGVVVVVDEREGKRDLFQVITMSKFVFKIIYYS